MTASIVVIVADIIVVISVSYSELRTDSRKETREETTYIESKTKQRKQTEIDVFVYIASKYVRILCGTHVYSYSQHSYY